MNKYNIVRRDANKSYGIYKIGPGCHRIVKNLKDYSDEKEAIGDLMKLLDGEITERDLIGSSFEQDVEAGRFGCRINCLEATLRNIRNSLVHAIGDNDKLERATREAVKRINKVLDDDEREAELYMVCERCRYWKELYKGSFKEKEGLCSKNNEKTYSDDSCINFKSNAIREGLRFNEDGDVVKNKPCL